MKLNTLLREKIGGAFFASMPTCISKCETRSQANSQDKQPTSLTNSVPPSTSITMEEWMGDGRKEETQIKVDTGHIMCQVATANGEERTLASRVSL